MLSRFDTLLTRIVILVVAAVLSTFILVFFIVQFQMSSRDEGPRGALYFAETALLELQSRDWPEELSESELKQLKIDTYFIADFPVIVPNTGDHHDQLRARLGLNNKTPIGVAMSGPGFNPDGKIHRPPGSGRPVRDGPLQMFPPGAGDRDRPPAKRDFNSQHGAVVSIGLDEDRWVNLRTELVSMDGPRPSLLPMIVLIVLMVGIGIWAAVNAINPLRQMAKAANMLAADYKHEPLVEQGPSDVRESLRAFNRMGRRLETTVAGQRQLLAAIGHDLRTPITSLKLKVEMLSDPSERKRMSRALEELERITEAALAAATAGQSDEPFQPLDMHSLVDSLVEDLCDLGLDVTFEDTDARPIVMGRSDELTRALRNLVENAVRYGDTARVHLVERQGRAIVTIQDDGPGIPGDSLERVFEPLVRLEQSRNRETGGHGLGLHIAKNLIEAHDGRIELQNAPDGGLLATIILPLKTAA
ncbi:ATP-binding protein [Hyphomonas sp.]|jgi:signal transduction histidine kinase|uniref:sensor histidine kinase n=1 Tax=Hyphomonas sp. TaxID=87 RepID=UPI0032D95904